ncbi:unnamed protein product [Brachionus calyciflorus]|uniref:Uncharacterized protein n=1 Tax=Brachionus calyciflorus TaxID=104777 RepID=A0A814FDC7_9BILA|nr:unnamed protein product [Brachionus calyciflorus]
MVEEVKKIEGLNLDDLSKFIFDLSNIQDNKIIKLYAKSDDSFQNKKFNFEWLPKLINIDFLQHLIFGSELDYDKDSFLGLSKQLISLEAHLSGKDIENFFSHLPILRNLILYECDFNEMEPYFFKGLDRLKSLIFFGSELHVIKKGMFHHLKSLKKLYIITSVLDELKKDCFDGLESLSSLEIWRSHKFDDLCLKLDRKAFKSCRNLEKVILSECGLMDSDMLSLEKLKNLKYLCLTGNYLTDLQFVNNLKNLEALDIFDNNFDQDIFERFDEFSLANLRFLRFDSQNIPKFGENYKNLQAIDGKVYSDVKADLKLRRLNGLQKLDYLKLNVAYSSDHSKDENEPVLFIKNLKYFRLNFYENLFDLNPGDEEKYFWKDEARAEFAKVSYKYLKNVLEEYFQEIIDVSSDVKEELVKAFVQENDGRYNNLAYD